MAKRVFIGVGHGGMDPGAVGHVKEADANLTISLELKKQLEAAGLVVGISRVRDENDDINEEIREANAFKPDLAVEVHNNAGGGDGWECFIQTNQYAAQSKACAQAIEAEVKALGQKSRGLKTNSFGWTRLVKAPAVLLEGFFVDNKADAADFDTKAEQQELGRAYARGVLKYLGMAPGSTTQAPTKEPAKAPAKAPASTKQESSWTPAIGDVVQFDGTTHYIWATARVGSRCGRGQAKITRIERGKAHPYHLVKTGSSGPYGWVDAGTFSKASTGSSKKSVAEIAKEVVRGKWGNGIERRNKLQAAGYNPDEVQAAVNKLLK